jgi:hypothetical protein
MQADMQQMKSRVDKMRADAEEGSGPEYESSFARQRGNVGTIHDPYAGADEHDDEWRKACTKVK